MKRLLPLLLIATTFISTSVFAGGGPINSCQDITVQLDGTGNYSFPIGSTTPQTDAEQLLLGGSAPSYGEWQSFTPQVNGVLHSVSFEFSSAYTGSNVELQLFDGVGIGGTHLGTQSFGALPTGMNELILNFTLDVQAGNSYTAVLVDPISDQPIFFIKNDLNPYSGGQNSLSATSDFVFSTKILRRPEIDNGSTANGIASFDIDIASFTCANIGANTVTLTVTDNFSATSTCTSTVTVEDNIAPTATCQNVAVNLDGSGNGSVSGTDVNNGSTDVCGIASTTLGTGVGVVDYESTTPLGPGGCLSGNLIQFTPSTSANLISIELYDPNPVGGNLSNGSIKIIDDSPCGSPTILGVTNTSTTTSDGWYTLTFLTPVAVTAGNTYYFQSNSGLVCGGFSSDINPAISGLSYDPFGPSCSLGGAGYMVRIHTIDFTAEDPMTFTCVDAGTTANATLQVVDNGGNATYCTATLSINDNTPPTAVCQNHTLVLNGSGAATLTTGDINNGSTDNCGIDTYSLDQTAFNCSNIGSNPVTLTIEDVNGNTSSCNATVTVEDYQAPFITCPSDITVCADDATGAVVSYPAVTGSDNCTFVITQTDGTGFTSGGTFPLGPTTQTYRNTDSPAGNSASCSFTVTVNPTPVADYTATPACEGEATFFTDESTIDASSSIVSWEWDLGDGSAPVGLVDPIHAYADTGMYDVELVVTSAEGCTDTTTQSVHVGPVPSASFTVANGCEGNATVFTNTSTIDSGILTYSWDFGDSNTSSDENPSHTYAIDGTYTVTLTVTSDNGCSDVFVGSVEVYDSPTALFSATTECEGFATEFTNLSTGDGTLNYSWDFGNSSTSTDVNPTYTFAAAGDSTVVLTVTNDNSCTSTSTVVVTVNALPNVGFTFDDVCEGTATDFVNTSDAGTYAWDFGDSNSSTLEDVSHTYTSFGVYDVSLTVTDANFCINSATQQVEVYDLPDFTLTPSEVLCYGEETGSIVTNPQGTPAFPWSFSRNGGTPQVNDTFLDLPAGNYDVTVVDSLGCEFTVSTTITQPSDTLGVDVSALVDILCHGESSGEISVTATGGTSAYMYSIDAGALQSDGDFSGLAAGTHDLQIVDANSCVFDTVITLAEPDTLVLGLSNSENLLCNGDNSGEISVSGTGGVGPYEYNLDGGAYASDSTFSGLAAADYIVGVLDANGCSDTLHVTLTEPGILMLSILNTADANCFGQANGLIEVGASSGTPDYQYSIDGTNFQGSGLFAGLTAGTYTITVMDANGCTAEVTETIFEPSLLTIETNSVPVSCFGELTGEIEIVGGGGTLDYAYSIDEGDNFFANGGVFTGVANGEFIAVVQDANGCTASEGVVISQPEAAFDLDADVSDALCLDSASGMAILIGAGGTPTYTYSSDNSLFTSDNVFEGFAAGTYTLYAQDVNGCTDSVELNIGEPATSVEITNILLNNPACPNEASGTASVSATGGTPGYMYSSNAGNIYQTSPILETLNGGNHLVMVQDANGCVTSDTITLVSPELLSIGVDTIIDVACENDLNGEIHVIASGGTPSYNYTLNGGSIQSNGDYVNLSNGTYSIEIMDVNGCAFSQDFTVGADQMLPVADFTWTSSGSAVLFTNTSEFGDSYLWSFGDDSTSTEESPVHVYAVDGGYTVSLTVTNDCGETTVTHPVNTIFTGIDEADEITFSLFPNPVTYELNLQPSKNVDGKIQVELVSATGQLIRTKQLTGIAATEITQIDINGLSQGMYYLRLMSDKQQTVLRFDIIK